MSQIPPAVPTPPAVPPPVIGYATPSSYQQQAMAQHSVWHDGVQLVCVKDVILPNHCCILCDQPAEGKRLRKKFTWHHPALYLLIFLGVLLYAIVAMIVQKKATLWLPLCLRHQKRRSGAILIGWALFITGGIALVVGIANSDGWIALGAGGAILAAAIVGVAGSQTISPQKMDDHYAWFRGASPAYLAALPGVHRG